MPADQPVRVPSYRLHRPSNRAVVTLKGTDVYLGEWRSPESRQEYRRVIAEYLASGGLAPRAADADGISVLELANRYWQYAKRYYVKDGRPTRTLANIKVAIIRLRRLYEATPAADFGPLQLKAVREKMIADDLSVRTVNYYTDRIKAAFRWGVAEGLIPPSSYHGLQAVAGLRRGRGQARETAPVRPVADAIVDATLPQLPPVVRDMVEVQRLTGLRSSELCSMTTGALDTTGKVWLYRVEGHKTEHHGKVREAAIGPRAQAVIRRYLRPELDAPLFAPSQSEAGRSARRRANRESPMTPSQEERHARALRNARRRRRPPGDRYTPDSYRRAITRACSAAFPHPTLDAVPEDQQTPEQQADLRRWRADHSWHPHQLRHSRATDVRKHFGLDAAGAVLGHSCLDVTQIYAERTREVAERVALATG